MIISFCSLLVQLKKKRDVNKTVCINKKIKFIRLEMQFFFLILIFHGLYLDYCLTLFGFNLYHTNFLLNNNDCHCLYYFTSEVNLAYQFIQYCIRFQFDDEIFDDTNSDNSFTFEDLYKKNITSQQLYEWSASIDLIESYQNYLENNISASKFRFYNCTYPWFGSYCEYRFDRPRSYFSEQIQEINLERQNYLWMNSPVLSCYTYITM